MRLIPVLSRDVAATWPQIAHWIDGLAERFPGWCRMPDPRGACIARDAQLWLIRDGSEVKGAVITRITIDNERIAEVPVVVGEGLEDWLHLLEELEAWARREGCVAMVSTAGREGWVRILNGHGWRKVAVLMERRL